MLNWCDPTLLKPTEWAESECLKRDLVIREYASGKASPTAVSVVELKIIYASYSSTEVNDKLFDLRAQICRRAMADEDTRTRYSGIVIAVWDTWQTSDATHVAFFERVSAGIQKVFDPERFGPKDEQQVICIVPPEIVVCCGQEREIGVATALLELLDVDELKMRASERAMDRGSAWSTTAEVQGYLRSLN